MKTFFDLMRGMGLVLFLLALALVALVAAIAKFFTFGNAAHARTRQSNAAGYGLAALLIALGLCISGTRASAQPYTTNSTLVPGPYQYDVNYVAPYNASTVISNQVAHGICQGTILPGQGGLLGSALIVSNNFYCTYSTPPTVTASSSLAGTNGCIYIAAVSKTAFILGVSTTNANTVYWQSIGH